MTNEARDPEQPEKPKRQQKPGQPESNNDDGSGATVPGPATPSTAENEEPPESGQEGTGGDESEPAEQLDLPLKSLLDWGTDPRDAEKELAAQTEEALMAAERDEYLHALQRLQADFDNFRKRSMRQQTEMLERATEGLCGRLLPVLDALDLAVAHVRTQKESSDAAKALEQIDSLLRDILAREGIERIDAVGVPFDPTIHDAVGRDVPEAGSDHGPTVAEVMRAGYRLKSKVLRPAMVIVGG